MKNNIHLANDLTQPPGGYQVSHRQMESRIRLDNLRTVMVSSLYAATVDFFAPWKRTNIL